VLGLLLFCTLFFGFSLIGGRPLTMHEGVLPQSAREMYADHDWVVPKNGGRPWLESPPLPQWTTVGIASLFGHCDQVWIVRIGPALMGTIAVLLVAWMAAGWYGRGAGICAGLIQATIYEFAQYSWQAEDEIFLCTIVTAAVALFIRCEFFQQESAALGSRHFFGKRTWGLLAFFVVLGMTNLAKGLIFGTAHVLIPVAGFLLWNLDWRRISFYFWSWGWLAFLAVAAAWPLAAWMRYHDVVDLWFFDHVGRLDGVYEEINQPIYYYLKLYPTILAPWSLLAPLALIVTRTKALREKYSPERFLWCWAILTPLVFSIPHGKHHHYMLHCVAPWAILCAPTLVWLHEKIQAWPARLRNPLNSLATLALPAVIALWVVRAKLGGPAWLVPVLSLIVPLAILGIVWGLLHARRQVAAVTLFATVALAFCGGHWLAGKKFDQSRHDAAFLEQTRKLVGNDKPVAVNTRLGSLDEFRILFALPDSAIALHNLSFLADEKIPHRDLYVIGRASDAQELSQFGAAEVVLQSVKTRREKSPADRFTLFHLQMAENHPRYSAREVRVSPMQAMQRAEGPWLGMRR
jgi:4-amino-4-deoxy-L-arabinose transferase-like glycosyltransferase